MGESNCFLNLGASPEKSFERKRRRGQERERQGKKRQRETDIKKDTERQRNTERNRNGKKGETQTHTSERHGYREAGRFEIYR